jgi:tetratricopeptide (TPR) repeat protein
MRSLRSLSTYWQAVVLLLALLFFITSNAQAQENKVLSSEILTIPISCLAKQEQLTHTYEFEFSKGEYIEILCQQNGSDVRLNIINPEGKKVAVIDSYSGAYGPECWRGFSNVTAKYKVEVEVLSTRGSESSYKISLPVRKTATPTDIKRSQAQELYNRAWRFRNGTQREADEAYLLYEQAAIFYREASDGLGEAQATASSAALGLPTLTKRLQTDLYRSSLDLCRRIHESSGEAIALHSLGQIYAEDARYSLAITAYKQALQAYRAIGDWQGEAIALNSLAMVYYQVNQPLESLSYLKQAAKVCQKGCDHSKEAIVMHHIGEIYEEMGESAQAAEYYRQAKELEQ